MNSLRISAHAQVRYLERYVDRHAVTALRREGLKDSDILAALNDRFAAELAEYKSSVGRAFAIVSAKARDAIAGIDFALKVGGALALISGAACVTTLKPPRLRWRADTREAARHYRYLLRKGMA